jgi:hypothetical protein
MEAFLGDGLTENASDWIMALAAGVAAYGLWRSRVPEPAPAA